MGQPSQRAWKHARGHGRGVGLFACLALLLAILAAAVAHGSAGTTPAAEASATFGKTTVGASADVFAANRKRVSGGRPESGSRRHAVSPALASACPSHAGMLRVGASSPCVASRRPTNSRNTTGSPSVTK